MIYRKNMKKLYAPMLGLSAELLIHLTTFPIIISVIYKTMEKHSNMDNVSMTAKIFAVCAIYFVLAVIWRLYMIHDEKQIEKQAEEHCARIFGKRKQVDAEEG